MCRRCSRVNTENTSGFSWNCKETFQQSAKTAEKLKLHARWSLEFVLCSSSRRHSWRGAQKRLESLHLAPNYTLKSSLLSFCWSGHQGKYSVLSRTLSSITVNACFVNSIPMVMQTLVELSKGRINENRPKKQLIINQQKYIPFSKKKKKEAFLVAAFPTDTLQALRSPQVRLAPRKPPQQWRWRLFGVSFTAVIFRTLNH